MTWDVWLGLGAGLLILAALVVGAWYGNRANRPPPKASPSAREVIRQIDESEGER